MNKKYKALLISGSIIAVFFTAYTTYFRPTIMRTRCSDWASKRTQALLPGLFVEGAKDIFPVNVDPSTDNVQKASELYDLEYKMCVGRVGIRV